MLLAGTATSKQDNAVLGPYKVSFDLGIPNTDYTTKIDGPKTSESLSGSVTTDCTLEIESKSADTAIISLSTADHPQAHISGERLKGIIENHALNQYPHASIDSAVRQIDGTEGAVASVDAYGVEEYFAIYQPNITDPVVVIIGSTLPWDKGTSALIKTIHIEPIAMK